MITSHTRVFEKIRHGSQASRLWTFAEQHCYLSGFGCHGFFCVTPWKQARGQTAMFPKSWRCVYIGYVYQIACVDCATSMKPCILRTVQCLHTCLPKAEILHCGEDLATWLQKHQVALGQSSFHASDCERNICQECDAVWKLPVYHIISFVFYGARNFALQSQSTDRWVASEYERNPFRFF